MDTTNTTEPAGKRASNGSVILTDRICEKRVSKRFKFYDRQMPGPLRQHHPGRCSDLFLQVHRPDHRQAAVQMAGRL